ncbi:MAG: Peptidyl-tRNA hydrolase [Clostridiaceae bacterium]|jgi:PTH2 family peptidyl-tRNA hydrolase|nr:Peptidyl-tRNA hydrolase [Clostridiaceae bacterium]
MSKQVIVMRKDLNMTKGKMVAQGSHASLGVILKMMNNGFGIRDKTPEIIDNKYIMKLDIEIDSELD